MLLRRNWNRKVWFQHDGKWDRGVQRGYTDGDDDESVMPEAHDMSGSLDFYYWGVGMLNQVSVFVLYASFFLSLFLFFSFFFAS